jgi:hypothetical protein
MQILAHERGFFFVIDGSGNGFSPSHHFFYQKNKYIRKKKYLCTENNQ